MRFPLRARQQKAVSEIREAFGRGFKSALFVAPCAFGKTYVFAHITEGAAAKGNRVLVLVHRKELLTQCSAELDALGVHHGLISPDYKHTTDMVQVASVQTLVRRLHKEPPPALIIVDEAHHAIAGSWSKILAAYPNAKVLGVTASPCRTDNRGLGDVFDTMILGPSVRELIADGHLSKPVVYAPPNTVDIAAIKHKAGDFDAAASAAVLDKASIYGSATAHYKKLCDGKPAIAFCATVAHAHHTAEAFRAAGWNAAALDGNTEDAPRRQMIRDLGTGALNVLTSCDVVSEGTNIPSVFAAILLRPTESTGLFIQQTGRAMRIYAGKTHAVICDHVGSVAKHGMPDDDREWSLDGTKQGKSKTDDEKVQRMKMCGSCYGMNPVYRLTCEQCGVAFEAHREPPKQVDGELTEITEEQKDFMRRAQAQLNRARGFEEAKAQSLEDYQRIAKQRGYAPQWAHIRWNAKRRRQAA